jgi:hypothetical protein
MVVLAASFWFPVKAVLICISSKTVDELAHFRKEAVGNDSTLALIRL